MSAPRQSLESEKRSAEFIAAAEGSSVPAIRKTSSQNHRRLEPRHVHLLAIGGTIGTAVFLGVGSALTAGGPLSLLIGFTFWSSVGWAVNEGQAEMVCELPIESSFIRFAGRYVDESVGIALGYTYTVGWIALVCFEIVSFGIILSFWTGALSNWAKGVLVTALLLAYAVLNLWNVKWFGEAEFWSSLGKVVLITGLIIMTFIVMVGGNPKHWAFGFTYWKNPGAMAEYISTGSLGRFQGLLQCLITAGYTIGGPDVLSLAAGEAKNPRKTMPFAFKSVMFRLVGIFILGALTVGIIVPYNNPRLLHAIASGAYGAAASPYVVGMQLLDIPVLPHIVNAGILTSVFSAGNGFVYCSSRSLHGLAVDGHAHRIFLYKNRNGVPIFAVLLVLLLGALAFMQLNQGANTVLNWFINIVTAAQTVAWACMALTHIQWAKAMKVQGFSRDNLIYKSRIQPWGAYYALVCCCLLLLINGYTVFLKGYWSYETFIFSYIMIPFFLVIFAVHKLVKRTKWHRLADIDLVGEIAEIEAYEAELAAEAKLRLSEEFEPSNPKDDEERAAESASPVEQPKSPSGSTRMMRRLGKRLDKAGFILY
ncbi:hypothetical protein DL93DRAFT_1609088 [Clavulina sp. PMI_390]|nr:hypothetical protein DL93DRAFT_1609088 [Clavulina sp. PMI_390]